MRSGRNSMGLQETPWSILAISPDKIPVKSKRGLGGRRQVWAIRKVLDATLAQSFGLRLLTPLPPQALKGHGLVPKGKQPERALEALRGQLQPTGACQHSMGVCDVGPGGCAAVHGVGEGSRAAPGRLQSSDWAVTLEEKGCVPAGTQWGSRKHRGPY